MILVSIAFRNILRNKRRSLATLSAMMLGVITIILFGGFNSDIGYALETGYVQRGGHVQIQHKDYFAIGSGNPAAYGMGEYQKIIELVSKDPVLGPMLTVVTPILQFGGVAGNFDLGLSRTVLVTGMDIAGQNKLHEWNDYHTFQDQQPSALTGTSNDSVIVGMGVARVLQLCSLLQDEKCQIPPAVKVADAEKLPDDIAALSDELQVNPEAVFPSRGPRVELLAANSHGAPNVTSLLVKKAETQGVKALDDVFVAMHLAASQQLLFANETPKATSIILQFKHTADLPIALQRIAELIQTNQLGSAAEPLEFHDFAEIYPFYIQAKAMFKTIFGFISVLIGSIVLFTVSNTMSMAVIERTVEVGTLRALGQRRSGIMQLFLVEGFILGAMGAVAGVFISYVIAEFINNSGMRWTPPGWINTVPFSVRVTGEYGLVCLTAVAITAVAVLSAWWPARRAAKLNITVALRHV